MKASGVLMAAPSSTTASVSARRRASTQAVSDRDRRGRRRWRMKKSEPDGGSSSASGGGESDGMAKLGAHDPLGPRQTREDETADASIRRQRWPSRRTKPSWESKSAGIPLGSYRGLNLGQFRRQFTSSTAGRVAHAIWGEGFHEATASAPTRAGPEIGAQRPPRPSIATSCSCRRRPPRSSASGCRWPHRTRRRRGSRRTGTRTSARPR